MKRRVLIVLAVVVPLTLFVVARKTSGLRPELMAANSPQTLKVESFLSRQSSSGRWTAMMTEDGKALLWDKTQQKMRVDIAAGDAVFSSDEKWFATVRPLVFAGPLEDFPRSSTKVEGVIENLANGQKIPVQSVVGIQGIKDCAFNADGSLLIAVADHQILSWNVANGRLISNVKANFKILDETNLQLFSKGTQIWASQWNMKINGENKTFVFDAASGKQKRVYPYQSQLLPDERFFLRLDPKVASGLFIHRVSDGKQVFYRMPEPGVVGMPEPLFSDDGKWLLIYRQSAARLIEVGTWRETAQAPMPIPYSWQFDDTNHILTQDDKGRVYRWRLR